MIVVHLLCAVVMGAAWYFSGLLESRIKGGFFLLLFHGFRGGLLAVAVSTLFSALISNTNYVLSPYSQSRNSNFVFFTLGCSLITIPVGFLLGLAKGQGGDIVEEFRELREEKSSVVDPNADGYSNYRYGDLETGTAEGYADPKVARASSAYRGQSGG
ncbi:MAG: hypothetical protein K6A35_03050 [bacterium]|nr:hypothetical protein [bacterium]